MSWLSEGLGRVGIHVRTPDAIKRIGDKVGGFVIHNVPGGDLVDGLFDLTNTRGGGPTLETLAAETWSNASGAASTGLMAANAAAVAQQSATTSMTGLRLFLSTPVGLATAALVAFLLLRKR